jgi:predicted transcriptional regulator
MQQVQVLAKEGYKQYRIAEILGITDRTVRNDLSGHDPKIRSWEEPVMVAGLNHNCGRLLAGNISLSKELPLINVQISRLCFVLHGKP